MVVRRGRPATKRAAAATPAKPATRRPAKKVATAAAPVGKDVTQYNITEFPTKVTAYHKVFAKWIVDEVGYDPADASGNRGAFLAGVALATLTRPDFMNSEALETWREKTGVAKRGPKRAAEVEVEEEAPKPRTRRAKAAPEPEPEEIEEEEDEEFEDEEESDEFDEDDEEEDAEEDEEGDEFEEEGDEFEEEEAPAPAPRKRAAPAKKVAPAAKRAPAKAAPAKTAGRRAASKPAANDDEFIF